ncbi:MULTISPECIES: hypothetical protein [unclassified Streptomyces]|uniref:hypothetical protein n=1 Tax=unclassified Streptomyces TaxID=2593676 RepID=UPI001F07C20B|nr:MULTISPECIES: hypothetical protein [unclassified Streptomyces]
MWKLPAATTARTADSVTDSATEMLADSSAKVPFTLPRSSHTAIPDGLFLA